MLLEKKKKNTFVAENAENAEGEVLEWLKRHAWKACIRQKCIRGSNPRLSAEMKENSKEKVVTFLGRITMQKGPEYFVEAAALVLKRTRNIRFVMAGSGDMLDAMINLAAERGIADRFHFPGFQRGRQVYEAYKNSDVFVMPSVSEPFGIAPLEAMQCGTPSIISKQSGCAAGSGKTRFRTRRLAFYGRHLAQKF